MYVYMYMYMCTGNRRACSRRAKHRGGEAVSGRQLGQAVWPLCQDTRVPAPSIVVTTPLFVTRHAAEIQTRHDGRRPVRAYTSPPIVTIIYCSKQDEKPAKDTSTH